MYHTLTKHQFQQPSCTTEMGQAVISQAYLTHNKKQVRPIHIYHYLRLLAAIDKL